jgi:hypothetical protein
VSQVRVHNFSISLDGFGTGDGITIDAPFGHAGERLHEWMFATRYWCSMVGQSGWRLGRSGRSPGGPEKEDAHGDTFDRVTGRVA